MRVLVTRPEPGASRTAARLAALGHDAVLLPLSAVTPLPFEPPAPDGFDALAATSANALRHLPAEMQARLGGLRCYAVGPGTGRAAREAGFAVVTQGPGGADGLATSILTARPRPDRLLYLTGRVRMPDFERALREAGIQVVAVETYDTVEVEPPREALLDLPADRPVDAVLLHSGMAATAYCGMRQHGALPRQLETARPLCISMRVADALDAELRGRARVAARPDEDALLALLGATV